MHEVDDGNFGVINEATGARDAVCFDQRNCPSLTSFGCLPRRYQAIEETLRPLESQREAGSQERMDEQTQGQGPVVTAIVSAPAGSLFRLNHTGGLYLKNACFFLVPSM